jgi:hypothetical protein
MDDDEVRGAVRAALAPGRIFIADGEFAVVHHPPAPMAWELFAGHLLDERQTRLARLFESWDVLIGRDQEPLLAVLLDGEQRQIHVVRRVLVYAHEAYESQPNVVETREVRRWQRELVASWDLASFASADRLAEALGEGLFLAVIGTSRLPITSLESPLPAFSLGQLGYLPGQIAAAEARPASDLFEFIDRGLAGEHGPLAAAKALETALRAVGAQDVVRLAGRCWQRLGDGRGEPLIAVVRTMFGHLALSPYTPFFDRFTAWLMCLADGDLLRPAGVIDLVGYMLRHLVRHLTAFDLVTFHNRGTNYPDALALDALLKALLVLIDRHEELFLSATQDPAILRRRRRALRQACLVRRHYEGLAVPDAPTSPGENTRVLPEGYVRVPEEQIVQTTRRRKTLFAGDPLDERMTPAAGRVLAASLADLEADDAELRELGMALFLDRPLGALKGPGETDRTPLLSYEAFSPRIAVERLQELSRLGLRLSNDRAESLVRRIGDLAVDGLVAAAFDLPQRPGVVGLDDALKAAPDFIFLRTTRRSLDELLSQYDDAPGRAPFPDLFEWLATSRHVLLLRRFEEPPGQPAGSRRRQLLLTAYDHQMRPRLELACGDADDPQSLYVLVGARELLRAGLHVTRIWNEDPPESGWQPRDVASEGLRLFPRLESITPGPRNAARRSPHSDGSPAA